MSQLHTTENGIIEETQKNEDLLVLNNSKGERFFGKNKTQSI